MTDIRETYRDALIRAVGEARPFVEAVRELREAFGVSKSEGRRVRLSLAAGMLLAAAESRDATVDAGSRAMIAVLIDPSI